MALISTLGACSNQDEASSNVVSMENDMNTMAADPNNPFAQSEMTMDKAMMAAVGVNAADSWVRKMIEHHRGAVEMSRIVLTQSPTADVAKMAQMTIDMQGKEIADLEKMIATGTPDPASAELYRSAAMQMHDAMMAASGANISETYLARCWPITRVPSRCRTSRSPTARPAPSARRSRRPRRPSKRKLRWSRPCSAANRCRRLRRRPLARPRRRRRQPQSLLLRKLLLPSRRPRSPSPSLRRNQWLRVIPVRLSIEPRAIADCIGDLRLTDAGPSSFDWHMPLMAPVSTPPGPSPSKE